MTADPFEIITLQVACVDFRTTRRRVPELHSILSDRYGLGLAPDYSVRRVLDLGAGCGAFAIYAYHRWCNPWIDAWEIEACELPLLRENGPPGLRVLDAPPLEDWSAYDVVRIARPVPAGPRNMRAGAILIADHVQRVGRVET